MARSVLFPYKPVEQAVDNYFRSTLVYHQACSAWQMFKGMIIINSIVHYDVRPSTTEYMAKKALHLSWEDACVALRGGGDNAMTGPLLSMWTNIYNDDERVKLGQAMNAALVKVYQRADALGYKHRYEETWRVGPVVIDDAKFTLPVAIPSRGRRMRDWAMDEGLDLDFVQEYLMDIVAKTQEKRAAEEQESLTPAMPKLTVLRGGRT